MILGLAIIVALAFVIALAIREINQLRYTHSVRHLPMITELQARQNAAPLSTAVINRLPGDPQ